MKTPLNRCMAQITSCSWARVPGPNIEVPSSSTLITVEAPIFDMSGYASSTRSIIKGLINKGIHPAIQPRWFKGAIDIVPVTSKSANKNYIILEDEFNNKFKYLLWIHPEEVAFFYPFIVSSCKSSFFIIHMAPYSYGIDHFKEAIKSNPGNEAYIGSTMYETDRLPQEWVKACNQMDQVWVPSTFNIETFSSSGVFNKKIRKVPLGVDTSICRPGLYLKNNSWKDQFIFLSVFEWSKRKGWDILIKAFALSFSRHEQAVLLLRCSTRNNLNIKKKIHDFIRKEALPISSLDQIILIDTKMDAPSLFSLYETCDCFVLPSRGEGWGMPYLEAMAFGKPVIGTDWGGNTEFMTKDNSFLIEVEKEEHLTNQDLQENICLQKSHKYAKPSLEHLIEIMQTVYNDSAYRNEIAKKGFHDAHSKWSSNNYAQAALKALH